MVDRIHKSGCSEPGRMIEEVLSFDSKRNLRVKKCPECGATVHDGWEDIRGEQPPVSTTTTEEVREGS